MTFARTKIQAPRPRSTFVERDLLQAQLADALTSRRVVLLCAPAGYGKTMLLAREIARLPERHAVAWISADTSDDLQRLVECMLAALEPFDPPWRTAPEALVGRVGRKSSADEDAVATELINTLDACDVAHGVIVFDDVHRVDDPAFFRFLEHVIARLSSRWTIALTSRIEPPLALARLRAGDELAEFRQLQLQFARDEARDLAAAAGIDQVAADRIFDRTQGWPAGMRIAIGAIRAFEPRPAPGSSSSILDRALRAGERPLFEFLTTEVLGQLRPELSDFLLRTSVLSELEASRCAAVSGHADAARLLDEIERLGLFVDVLDGPVRTLRVHDLFREAMLQRLALERPAILAELRAGAAATEPDPVRRIAMLVEAGAYDEAADLAFAHLPSIIATAGPATAQHLIGQFPASFREQSPDLAFVLGVSGWTDWNFAMMLDCFERAERGYAAAGKQDRALLARAYRAHVVIARYRLDEGSALLDSMESETLPIPTRIVVVSAKSWLALETGRLHAVATLRSEMLDMLERADRIDLWWHTTPPNRIPGLPGMTRPLLRHAEALLRVAGDEPTPLRALGLLSQAWCALWQGRFAKVRTLHERAIDNGQWAGDTFAVRSHLLASSAFLHAIAGDARAIEIARERVRTLERSYDERGRDVLRIISTRVAVSLGDANALSSVLDERAAIRASRPDVDFMSRRWPEAPAKAQLAWLQGRFDRAIASWQEALEHEEAIDEYGQAAETRVRLARGLVRRGAVEAAAGVLGPMFERAEADSTPGGALLAFDALQELAAIDWRDALTPEQQGRLREWVELVGAERAVRSAAPSASASAPLEPPDLAGGLTARELDVLRRIAAGDSNKLIARALDLSLHTVKRHVANILGKLDAETRGQAAAWYRARQR